MADPKLDLPTSSSSSPQPSFPAAGLRVSEQPMRVDSPDAPNVAVIREFLSALDSGDTPAARALLANDVHWDVVGRGPVAGPHDGPEEVLAVDATLRRLSGGTLRHHVLIWLAAGEHAHAVARQSATRNGTEASFDRAFVFTVSAARITEIHAYTDDLYAFDAFWS